jgi:hypothetical protein
LIEIASDGRAPVTRRLNSGSVGSKLDRLVPLRVRAAALMPAAVLTVHQLRFQLAFGGQADSRLAAEGHQYLSSFFAPLAAMALAIGIGLFLATLAQAWRQAPAGGGRAPSSFPRVWLLAAAALLAIYCGQELLEGLLASGHPGGLAGVFGAGGLWAIPLSGLLGAVVAAGLHVAAVAVEWVARVGASAAPRRACARPPLRPTAIFLSVPEPLASAAAGRAPPLLAPLTS